MTEAADEPVGERHWFEDLADHMGPAYLRYSFTKGTRQEVDFLVSSLDFGASTRVLDVGCGPGRHSHELARRGVPVHGVDISHRFIELAAADAPIGASFERLDARCLPTDGRFDGTFDRVMSLCQGGFGLPVDDGDDTAVLTGMTRALRAGGMLVITAFNAYFSVRYQTDATFDADRGVASEHTEVRDSAGVAQPAELHTGCYTPRELRLLARSIGLDPLAVYGIHPGKYAPDAPTVEHSEFMLIARKP